MNNPLAALLEQQGYIVLDGALATELEHKGADLDDPLWSAKCLLESPELIRQVHRDYLQAGADIISTATYQASAAGFRSRGLSGKEARKLMLQGVKMAIEARDDFWSSSDAARYRRKPLVATSMGPFGACLFDGSEYHGNYAASWREVSLFHRERLLCLAEAGADVLAFETIPSRPEAEILLELLEKHVADLQGQLAWISFSCKDSEHVCHGETFAECMALLASSEQIAAGGINCTAPNLLQNLLESVDDSDLPLAVYPNSGETWEPQENCWLGESATDFAIEDWFDAGARLIGGCCRTRPEDISRIRIRLSQLQERPE
jgi:homocysteine S-methyltransferase